jgi:hypothetical protein
VVARAPTLTLDDARVALGGVEVPAEMVRCDTGLAIPVGNVADIRGVSRWNDGSISSSLEQE